jgi:hypothetical protein
MNGWEFVHASGLLFSRISGANIVFVIGLFWA